MVFKKNSNYLDYYCEVYDIFIKRKSKYNRFKLSTQKEIDKCGHVKLTNENPDVNRIDNAYYWT